MHTIVIFAMCTCASPKVGGFQAGHGKVELLFRPARSAEMPPLVKEKFLQSRVPPPAISESPKHRGVMWRLHTFSYITVQREEE